MARYQRFTFLCNQDERRFIENLARHLQRTQSDAIRMLIREAAQQMLTTDNRQTEFSEVQHATSAH